MKYISTHSKIHPVTLAEAITTGIAADGGLYVPERLPQIPSAFFRNYGAMSLNEIAYVVSSVLLQDDLDAIRIKRVVDHAFNFPVPVAQLDEGLFSAELFHGPTLACKDFGARMMGALLNELTTARGRRMTVLVATTGNTGSAVANGFAGFDGVDVYILFPRGVAGRQLEAQFVTLGGNIHAVEVDGSIDDCHALAAQAFADKELVKRIGLTTANSTNVARLLPQTIYFFYAMSRVRSALSKRDAEVTVALPAGNLGNLTAALMAQSMGLRIDKIIAAENANAFLTSTLQQGIFPEYPRAKPTLAPAADKGVPTNIGRVYHLCGGSIAGVRSRVRAVSVDDGQIIDSVNHCHDTYNYTIDPHTALAYTALLDTVKSHKPALMLATAHPAKSLTAMSAITGRAMELPLQLTRFMSGTDKRTRIVPSYTHLRNILTSGL